jgi:hypothetical protein
MKRGRLNNVAVELAREAFLREIYGFLAKE